MSIFAYVLIGIILYIIFTNKSLKEIYINIMAIFIFTYMHIEVGYFIKLGNTSVRFVWFLEIILIMFSIILLIKNKSVHKKILMNGIAFFFHNSFRITFFIHKTIEGNDYYRGCVMG